MVLQRYGLVVAILLIITLGITGAPVMADEPPESGSPVLMAANSTLSGQPLYTFSVLADVPPGSGVPVLMADNPAPPDHTFFTVPPPSDYPPDIGDRAPAPVGSAISRNTPGGAPASAASDSISPGDSLQVAIDAAADGDTIYLDPGTYFEHGITISKNITIRANASAGGSRDNTIIDALQVDRIFSMTGAYSFTLDNLTLRNSTVSYANPSSYWGGAVNAPSGGTLTVTSLSFSNCSAVEGGAINSNYGMLRVTSSAFSNCSVLHRGGAIYSSYGTLNITTTSFSNCSAIMGGAIYLHSSTWNNYHGIAIINSSTFSDCTSLNGGAINCNANGILTVNSSSFTNCSATAGGAIINFGSTTLHFSRFYQNAATGSGPAVYATAAVNATNNWWGSNSDPSGQVWGPVTTNPWLVLSITANPASITTAGTSAIRANLTYDSTGADTSGGGIFVPATITNTFAVVSGGGWVLPLTAKTANGAASTTFTPAGIGNTNISATVDDQTVYHTLSVIQAPVTIAPAPIPTNAQDYSGSNSDDSPAAIIPLMTVTVNIGGNSAAGKTTVTGTQLSELVVTGIMQSGPGSNLTAPQGIVYQYISIVPVRYAGITKAVINFTVPQSWLDENHIAPANIVMYCQTANGWEALPTAVLYTKDGRVYFSAQSTAFSLFAIAGTPASPAPVTVATTQGTMDRIVQEQTPAPAAVVKVPVTTRTTAFPAREQQPPGSSGFPVMTTVLIAIGGILLSGAMLVRRWWIQRQNPALFREYD